MSLKPNRLLPALAVLIGGYARFFHIGARSLWLDEAVSLEIAKLDWHNLLTVVSGREVNMSLYYVLLHFWIRLGQDEFALRALSAFFGTLAIYLIYLLASDWLGRSAGAFAALLMALNPALVAYSQEARAYSLTVLLAMASFLLLEKALNSGSWLQWAGFAVVTASGFYTHIFFLWIVVVQCIYLLYVVRNRESWQKILVSYGICGVLLLPLIWIGFTRTNNQLSWVSAPVSKDLLRFFVDMAGAGGGLLAGLYILFAAVGLLVLWRGSKAIAILLVMWWLLPVLVTYVVSFKVPIFVPRYLLICAPPTLMLAAAGVSSSKSVILQRLGLGVVLAVSAWGTHVYLRSTADSKQSNDWRGAAAYMSTVLGDQDVVLFYYGAERLPFEFYLSQHPSPADFRILPDLSTVDLLLGKAPVIDDGFVQQTYTKSGRIFVLSEFQVNDRWHQLMDVLSSRCSRAENSKYFGFVRIDELQCRE